MANNTEAYCENCGKTTLHFAYGEGWECDECGEVNSIGLNPYNDKFDE